MEKNYKVLFVCLGNICRSPAAQSVMQNKIDKLKLNDKIMVDSAGLISFHSGEYPDSRMVKAANNRGLIANHRARKIDIADFEKFDFIIGMDTENIKRLEGLCPSPALLPKIHIISEYFENITDYNIVPDPYYGTSEDFNMVLDLLENACEGLLKQLR